jgi:hypothetical protein
MTFAECLLVVCLFAGIYYMLRPLQRVAEAIILKFLGHNPKWVDAVIIKHDKD